MYRKENPVFDRIRANMLINKTWLGWCCYQSVFSVFSIYLPSATFYSKIKKKIYHQRHYNQTKKLQCWTIGVNEQENYNSNLYWSTNLIRKKLNFTLIILHHNAHWMISVDVDVDVFLHHLVSFPSKILFFFHLNDYYYYHHKSIDLLND